MLAVTRDFISFSFIPTVSKEGGRIISEIIGLERRRKSMILSTPVFACISMGNAVGARSSNHVKLSSAGAWTLRMILRLGNFREAWVWNRRDSRERIDNIMMGDSARSG
jgi:hypothetical protein